MVNCIMSCTMYLVSVYDDLQPISDYVPPPTPAVGLNRPLRRGSLLKDVVNPII